MKPEDLMTENDNETKNRKVAAKLDLSYEELTETQFELEIDEFQSFIKIIFDVDGSPSQILDKIDGLQDDWIIIDSISIPCEIDQIY